MCSSTGRGWWSLTFSTGTPAGRGGLFDNDLWFFAVYLGFFAIVLLHEFGHAFACRSVGGRADTIVLWPLGGIAYFQAPARPGAVLWTIAAGPLVNVALLPPLWLAAWYFAPEETALFFESRGGLSHAVPDWHNALLVLAIGNTVLLLFNMLPIYPLDGGQILQATLWFFVGRGQSMTVAASIGLVLAGFGGIVALAMGDFIGVAIAVFIGWQAVRGLRVGSILKNAESRGIPTDDRHPLGRDHPPLARRVGEPSFDPFGRDQSPSRDGQPPEVVATQDPQRARRSWKI